MPFFNQQNLDVRKTIETTFERAKGWLIGKYPSSSVSGKNIKIDVRYPGEVIPSSQNEICGLPMMKNEFDLTKKPVCVIFKRSGNEVYLRRDVFKDNKGNQQTSYIFSIHSASGHNYRIIETPDGTIKDQGNSLLLSAIRKDKDFGSYISFFSKNENENTCVSTQK